jgi:hypothetical protein
MAGKKISDGLYLPLNHLARMPKRTEKTGFPSPNCVTLDGDHSSVLLTDHRHAVDCAHGTTLAKFGATRVPLGVPASAPQKERTL